MPMNRTVTGLILKERKDNKGINNKLYPINNCYEAKKKEKKKEEEMR